VIDERTRQRFDLLVVDQRHLRPARVLQPRGEEVHSSAGPVPELDVNLAEVVLRELPLQPLEASAGSPRWSEFPERIRSEFLESTPIFAWSQWKRRLLVRWEYYASNFLGFVQLGCCISMLLREF
jgi:hypothetical protein